jgi:type III pantothenate kinase
MLLVIDVGNTHTVIGIFENRRLIHNWRIHTNSQATADEFHILLSSMFREADLSYGAVRKTVISCVVPPVVHMMTGFCRRYLDHLPMWVSPGNVNIPIRLDNPDEVGADRLVNAVAAYRKYGQSLIIIDFGTATTFDVVSEKGEYFGGAISPGIGIAAEALFSKASKLPRVEFQAPPGVIGKNTADSMKSGIIYGYAELVDGMVRRIEEAMAPAKPRIIATGGMAVVIKEHSECIETVESGLTLEGLRLISEEKGGAGGQEG